MTDNRDDEDPRAGMIVTCLALVSACATCALIILFVFWLIFIR